MTRYYDALCDAMSLCAEHSRSVFMGQAVAADGTGMSKSFRHLPPDRLLELPVAEEMQLGMSIGMSLDGMLPISVYPRWNFLILAASQLVNHLDKLSLYSCGGYKPKVIIRVAVPSPHPMDPGPQHLGNFTDAFALMLKTVRTRELHTPEDVGRCYREALAYEGSTILSEFSSLY